MATIAGPIGRLSTQGRMLVSLIRDGLAGAADSNRATKMQSYMKSDMPYFGVPAPAQRRIYRDVFQRVRLSSFPEWRSTVLTLWREASFREERYAAIELSGWGIYIDHLNLNTLPIFEEIIVTGAWWDYVDAVAIHRIGKPLLLDHPSQMRALLKRWSVDSNLWRRRTSIIAQVALKKETDLSLLYHCIEKNLAERDFFIRKAIGWALRQYAWVDPDEIRSYVDATGDKLSALSRREALKNIG